MNVDLMACQTNIRPYKLDLCAGLAGCGTRYPMWGFRIFLTLGPHGWYHVGQMVKYHQKYFRKWIG